MGVAMTLEDSRGGDVTTAAIAHLAHSIPGAFRFTAADFNNPATFSTAEGAPRRREGRMAASTAPGLGITPKLDVLGDPRVDLSWGPSTWSPGSAPDQFAPVSRTEVRMGFCKHEAWSLEIPPSWSGRRWRIAVPAGRSHGRPDSRRSELAPIA
jgi:hypothetical protein